MGRFKTWEERARKRLRKKMEAKAQGDNKPMTQAQWKHINRLPPKVKATFMAQYADAKRLRQKV